MKVHKFDSSNWLDFYYGWIVAIACFLMILSVFSISYSFGVFFKFILADLGYSRAQTSLIFSVQSGSLYVSAAVFGNLVDRYGSRPLLVFGTLLLTGGMVATGFASSLADLYLSYGVIAGAGMGIIYVIGFMTVSKWFVKQRGTATAIASSGTGIAILAAAPLASWLITDLGWQATYIVFSVGTVGALSIAAILLKDKRSEFEEPDNDLSQISKTSGAESNTLNKELFGILHSTDFLILVGGWMLIHIPLHIILVYLVVFTTDIGLPQWVGVWSLSIMGGMTIPGRFGLGILGDRIGRTRLFLIVLVIMNSMVLGIPTLDSQLALFSFIAVFGLLWGGLGSLGAPLIADLYGTDNLHTIYGFVVLGAAAASFVGPYFAGLYSTSLTGYWTIFIFSGSAGLLGTVFLAYSAKQLTSC